MASTSVWLNSNAFVLLSAMDQSDHKVIVNAMNTLLDENLVKEYSSS